MPPAERVRAGSQRRSETDYIFEYWSALGWTVLTLRTLVRRMREHHIRRLELFDASIAAAWEEAGRRGVQEELRPLFERAAGHLAVLRQMTQDFREPVIWLVLVVVARGIIEIVAFVLLDQDLVRHDRAEVGVEYEISLIYAALKTSMCRCPTRAG
ncbi:MAG: hypothetical protein QOD62_2094 [Actinomycetota bacterium]|nr:hypothetical protein [Actinomycetota bacterium]